MHDAKSAYAVVAANAAAHALLHPDVPSQPDQQATAALQKGSELQFSGLHGLEQTRHPGALCAPADPPTVPVPLLQRPSTHLEGQLAVATTVPSEQKSRVVPSHSVSISL